MRAFFYDTWAFLGLANSGDPRHDLCVQADESLEAAGYAAVTSDYVLDETLTGLHAAAGARVALAFADGLLARIDGGDVLLVEITGDLCGKALALFRRLAPDAPRLSFTDCTSFVAMRQLDIAVAFTADRHFHRAGGRIRPLIEEQRGALRMRPLVP